MLPVLKPYSCPRCELAFTIKDSYRGPASLRVPLLLKCGHSICEACANSIFKVLRNVTCPVCEKVTEIERGTLPSTKLLPDVYALGIANASLRQSLPNLKNKNFSFKPALQNENDSNALVICDICGRKDGKYRCRKCEDNFCNNCFDSFHRTKLYLKNHVPIPLYVEKYQSLVQEGCPEHEDRPIEFYCDDDNSLACSHCIVTGRHKGHSAVTLIDKNKSCAEDLRTLHDEVLLFSRRLKFTEQKLSQDIPNEKTDSSQWVKLIHSHFHDLHSALFLRENELLQQIDDICNTSVSHIEKLRDEVSLTIKDVDTVLMDASCVLEHPTISVSVPAILKKLGAAKRAPCHAVPVGDGEDNKDISVLFEDNFKELIARHGKIKADIKPKYTLKGTRELPPDFIVEPLPPDLAAGDNESVVSESFSEDSLCLTTNNKLENLEPVERYHHAGKIEKVTVCHIVDPLCFYVRKCSDIRKLADVISKISRYTRSDNFRSLKANLNEDFYVKGNLYLVQFTNDDQWYRGRFIDFIPSSFTIPGDDSIDDADDKNDESNDEESEKNKEKDVPKAEVYYIDYGNSEIVPVTRMRSMCPKLMRFEPLAKKCSLHEIVPVDSKAWTMSAKRVFQDFVFDKEVNMSIYEERGGVLYVDLYQVCIPGLVMDVPASVRDALVFLEHGCFYHEQELSKVKKIRQFCRFLPPERIGANSRVSVNITHIESPSEFYIQQLSSSRLLTELIMEMQKPYADEYNMLHAVYSPYVGMICAAQFQSDKMWYRAEVLGLPGGAQVEIEFVDFGYKQVLHHKYLRTILDGFTKLSRQAVQCSLADISFTYGTGWSKEATMWLNERIKFKRFSLLSLGYESSSTKTKSVLYDIEDDVETCINALMVEKGMAVSTGIYSTKVTKRIEKSPKGKAFKSQTSTTSLASCEEDSVITNTDTEKSFHPKPRPEVLPKPSEKLDEHLKIIISHIDSPGSFYIRIAKEDDEKRLENLMKAMQETYCALEYSVLDVAIGHDFAAYRESDKKWYRGIIQSIVDDDNVMVRFPDFGYIEKLSKKNLRPLLKKFEADSSYAVRCYLSGVIPAGDTRRWSQIATDKFKELAFPYETLYLINGTTDPSQPDTNSLPTDLLYEEIIIGGALEPSTLRYCSITEKLVEHGVAIPIRRKQKFESSKTIPAPSPSVPDESEKTKSSPNDTEMSPKGKDVVTSPKKEATIPKKPKHQWKPAKIPEALKFSAVPTQVGSDGCIYLQVFPEAVKTADMIKSVLQLKYEGSPFNAGRIAPPIGEAVVAEFELDKKFYRAEITRSCPRKLQVQFVDYGNCEVVSLDKIHIDPAMGDLPRQCLECELFDVHPPNGKYETKILDLIHTRIVEEICTVEVKEPPEEGKRLQISLDFSVGNLNSIINDIFSVPTVIDNDEEIMTDEEDMQENGHLHRYPPATPLRTGDPFPVCSSFVIEPSVIYLQRLKVENPRSQDDIDRNEELANFLLLIKHLQENAERFPPVTNPVKGFACCAQYTIDDSWYRCVVTDVTTQGVHVRYVDYGNSEIVPLDRLRLPDEMVLAFPVQAHLCKIRGIEPVCGEWTESVSSALVDVCFRPNTELFARFIAKSDINEVELLKQNEDETFELLYQELIDKGIFTIKY